MDIFSELQRLGYVQWIVPLSVLGELHYFPAAKADKGRDKIAARVALGLAEQCSTVGIDNFDADIAIEKLCHQRGRCGLHK